MNLGCAEKRVLLHLARKSIARELGLEIPPPPQSAAAADYEQLDAPCGAFVTLKIGASLRGCIGNMRSTRPLRKTVEEMARSSAFRDPRFPSLSREEYAHISIEISVLSPLRLIEDIHELIPGKHGLYLTCRGRSGVLLPQVATEQGWTREEFIRHTCLKAGCAEDTWKRPETKLELFTAEVFSEADLFR